MLTLAVLPDGSSQWIPHFDGSRTGRTTECDLYNCCNPFGPFHFAWFDRVWCRSFYVRIKAKEKGTMNIGSNASERLVEATAEYGSVSSSDCVVFVERLGINVRVKEIQTIEGNGTMVFISEFITSLALSDPGMNVTCVGIGENAQSASGNAVAQWVLGVLPVVATWRGDHSCLSSSENPTVFKGQFNVISGPIVSRGSESKDQTPDPHVVHFADKLLDALGKKKLAKRIHWLETFAVRHRDGAVDATCRLNNHDWSTGQRILIEMASAWPVPMSPMNSCRQFTMLVPKDGKLCKLEAPSLWNRIMGSA